MNNQPFNNIPFVIGVVGHCDLLIDNCLVADIKTKMIGIFDELNDDIPIILQSQLAKGADTLLAKIFLELAY